jgi:hypothetical protein
MMKANMPLCLKNGTWSAAKERRPGPCDPGRLRSRLAAYFMVT